MKLMRDCDENMTLRYAM